jgi:hypothetical protein
MSPIMSSNDEHRAMGPSELAERLSYSIRTVRKWTSEGIIPFVGPRNRPRYLWLDVVEALRGDAGRGR